MNTFIINLKKDTHRFHNIVNELHSHNIHKYERIEAVYGKDLKDSLKEHTTPFFSQFGTRATIGCAMSHIKTWNIIKQNQIPYAMIIEDDIKFTDDFDSLQEIIKSTPNDFDLLYLGYHFSNYYNKTSLLTNVVTTLVNQSTFKQNKVINKHIFKPKCALGLHSYIVSYKGACKLLDLISKTKIYFHIDAIITQHLNILTVYASKNRMSFQTKDDSNISSNYPITLYNVLSKIKCSEHEDSYSYTLFVPGYQVFDVPINIINGIICFIMILLGYIYGIRVLPTIITCFVILNTIEYSLNPNNLQNISNTFVMILLFFFVGISFKRKSKSNQI